MKTFSQINPIVLGNPTSLSREIVHHIPQEKVGPNAAKFGGGTDWVDLVDVGLSDTCLHCLVVSNGTLSAVKTRGMYRHFCTKTQMKHMSGCYWKEAPIPALKKDTIDLNDPTLSPSSRLHLLWTGSVGGLLIVTQLFNKNGETTGAFITILAAPLVMTYHPEPTEQKSSWMMSGRNMI
jgi:hypothetical protein